MEKFVGDAVMALFGAPVAHEDDPVRAALAIRDWVSFSPAIATRRRRWRPGGAISELTWTVGPGAQQRRFPLPAGAEMIVTFPAVARSRQRED